MKQSKISDPKSIGIKCISDHDTLKSIIKLLSYIRSALASNKPTSITLNIAQNRVATLSFSVNDEEIPQYFVKDSITIN
jgi:hypothetical protein